MNVTYNLLLTGPLEPSRIATALSEQFAVPAGTVDVADADDPSSRNWEASVSCTYEQVDGDVTWALEIYASDDLRPEERQLAAALAEHLGQPVLFPAEGSRPSSYWLAAPGGLLTRARLYQSEDDDRYVIDAVGQPVPQLPDLTVALQPEAIREHRMPTPATDAFSEWLAEQRRAADGGSESDEEWHIRTRLGAWEAFVARMNAVWPPDGWYPADYYQEDLEVRDQLETVVRGVPSERAARLADVLTGIDREFRRSTVDDGGQALALGGGLPLAAFSGRAWWWERRPIDLPWQESEGRL